MSAPEKKLMTEANPIEEKTVETEAEGVRVEKEKATEGLAERRDFSPLSPLATTKSTAALRDEMKKEYASSPLVKIDEEALYYDTIKNLDECGKCWTDCKKHYSSPFKVRSPGVRSSSYQKDYIHHTHPDQGPIIKNEMYESYQPCEAVSLGTTMRSDYKPWKANYVKHEGVSPTLGSDNAPCFGRSSYNSDFLNFGSPKNYVERYPHQKTVVTEIPFTGNSSYRDNFVPHDSKGFMTRWPNKGAKSPFFDNMPFFGESQNSSTYKPYKLAAMLKGGDKNEEYKGTQSFMNQFKTTYTKDFEGRQAWKCPAKIFMESNLPPNKKHLKPQ